MSLVEKLREISESLGWVFYYGRKDFQNLIETDAERDNKNYFFLDPVKRTPIYSDTGVRTGVIEYTGYFMILTKSDFDQMYDGQNELDIDNGRWREHIKTKIDSIYAEFENVFYCNDDLQVVSMTMTDAINVFDDNLDGVLVNYKIKQYT